MDRNFKHRGVFIYGDDAYTPEKDGFLYGEVMNWKIFTWTTDEKSMRFTQVIKRRLPRVRQQMV